MAKFTEIKVDQRVEYQRHKDREREKMVRADIARINETITLTDKETLLLLHKTLDGKYQTCISDWGKSMYGYSEKYGFDYELIGTDAIKDNLIMMKPKLEAFIQGWNNISKGKEIPLKSSDVNVTVNNTVNISLSFQEARQKIEDMTALTQAQTDEIIGKINELEQIGKETSSRKVKWEKVKPIITFVMDKGADVAIAILSLIVQMRIGI